MLVDFKREQPPVMSHTPRVAPRLARVGKKVLPNQICCQRLPLCVSVTKSTGMGKRVD